MRTWTEALNSGQGSPRAKTISRRAFLSRSGAVAGLVLSTACATRGTTVSRSNDARLLHEARKYRKVDAHNHIDDERITPKMLIESCDQLGIERVAVSKPFGDTPDAFRASNDSVLKAMKAFPDRILGQCFVNPLFQKEALEELNRCLGEGFCGLGELYTQVRLTDPVMFPLIERCISEKVFLLMHVRADTGLLRPDIQTDAPPTTTIPSDFVDAARRYPEAMLIHAHIGGGGDWEYMCKVLRDAPSVYVDTSGSVTDTGMVDFAKEQIGVDRLLFATDTNFETGVGKILAANLTEAERRQIFWDNFNGILEKRG